MKQNLLISIYQVVAVALCTLIIANIGLDAELLRITAYIVAAMLALNILVMPYVGNDLALPCDSALRRLYC